MSHISQQEKAISFIWRPRRNILLDGRHFLGRKTKPDKSRSRIVAAKFRHRFTESGQLILRAIRDITEEDWIASRQKGFYLARERDGAETEILPGERRYGHNAKGLDSVTLYRAFHGSTITGNATCKVKQLPINPAHQALLAGKVFLLQSAAPA